MSTKKNWTPREDRVLRILRDNLRVKKWSVIANRMKEEFGLSGRTGKQCRQRYKNQLDFNICRDDLSEEERNTLNALYEVYGKRWSVIAQNLLGRTSNYIKNHFYSEMRKGLRRLNKLISQEFSEEFRPLTNAMLSKINKLADSSFKKTKTGDLRKAYFCREIERKLFIKLPQLSSLKGEHIPFAKSLLHDIFAAQLPVNDPKMTPSTKSERSDLIFIPLPLNSVKDQTIVDSAPPTSTEEMQTILSVSQFSAVQEDDREESQCAEQEEIEEDESDSSIIFCQPIQRGPLRPDESLALSYRTIKLSQVHSEHDLEVIFDNLVHAQEMGNVNAEIQRQAERNHNG